MEALHTNAGESEFEEIWNGRHPRGLNKERWLLGRGFWLTGLTAPNQRARATFAVSHYLFFGDPSQNIAAHGYGAEDARKQLMTEWLLQKHNGFSEAINDGSDVAVKYIETVANWRPRELRTPQEGCSGPTNDAKAADAQRRIMEWVEKRKHVGFKSIREFSRISGISHNTLMKYRLLWEHLLVTNASPST